MYKYIVPRTRYEKVHMNIVPRTSYEYEVLCVLVHSTYSYEVIRTSCELLVAMLGLRGTSYRVRRLEYLEQRIKSYVHRYICT